MTLKFELSQYFCTVHQPTKFHHRLFIENMDSILNCVVSLKYYITGKTYMVVT